MDYEAKCAGLCQNGGSCVVDSVARSPKCDCPGEWQGDYCERPPDCQEGKCGLCDPYSNINECRCADGNVEPCRDADAANALSDKEETASQVLTTLIVIMIVLLFGISAVATFMVWLRRQRQPFHHARLGENVEITNPMYTGDADDGPVFVSSDMDKVHFANPVYESMYKGGSGPGLNSSSCDREMDTFDRGAGSSSLTELENLKGSGSPKAASEEKKGLLEHNQD